MYPTYDGIILFIRVCDLSHECQKSVLFLSSNDLANEVQHPFFLLLLAGQRRYQVCALKMPSVW